MQGHAGVLSQLLRSTVDFTHLFPVARRLTLSERWDRRIIAALSRA